jgi:RHS repeat-associated protein
MLVTATNTIAARYLYDAFGNILAKSGQMADTNLYRFSNKEADANSSLTYFGYRFYDGQLQRWVNQDPLANHENVTVVRLSLRPLRPAKVAWEMTAGPNVYTYNFNSPVDYVDVNGLWTFGVGLSFSWNWWIFNGSYSVGITGDTQGNINTWGTVGQGVTGAGAGVGGGVTVQVSNAKCNNDLKGPFGYGSIGGFLGGGGSVDGFWGNSDDGPVFGGGFTVGPGLGAGASAGLSGTTIK